MNATIPRKVFLVQEILPSYRVPIMRRLATLPEIDLTVFYSRPTKAMALENLRNATDMSGFRSIILSLVEVGGHVWQRGMIGHVWRNRPHVVIAGQAGRLDRMLLFFFCRMMGIRFLWFQGGVPYRDDARIHKYADRGRLNRWLGPRNPRAWAIRRAEGLITYTRHAKEYFAARGFVREQIWVAPNSPDTAALQVYEEEWAARGGELLAERRRFARDGEMLLFLLGRLNAARKVDTLLCALRTLREEGLSPSLVLVGDGGERPSLEAMAREYGLDRVFFIGAVYDERELTRYFMVADIFVTPGVASLAIKMAMALGTPVITVDHGLEVHDVDEGVNGFTFPMGDDDALADRLRSLLSSEALRKSFREEGRRTIRDRVNIVQMVEGFRKAVLDIAPDSPHE